MQRAQTGSGVRRPTVGESDAGGGVWREAGAFKKAVGSEQSVTRRALWTCSALRRQHRAECAIYMESVESLARL